MRTMTAYEADTGALVEEPGRAPGSWVRERARLFEVLVAAGVYLYNLPIITIYMDYSPRFATVAIVSSGLCAPWLLRRRYPLAVLAVMLAAAFAQLPLGVPIIAADVMLVFAVYNVATRYRWRMSVPAAADDRLHPVAQPELAQDAADVHFYRPLGEHELRGDLRVRHAAGDQPKHFATATVLPAIALIAATTAILNRRDVHA